MRTLSGLDNGLNWKFKNELRRIECKRNSNARIGIRNYSASLHWNAIVFRIVIALSGFSIVFNEIELLYCFIDLSQRPVTSVAKKFNEIRKHMHTFSSKSICKAIKGQQWVVARSLVSDHFTLDEYRHREVRQARLAISADDGDVQPPRNDLVRGSVKRSQLDTYKRLRISQSVHPQTSSDFKTIHVVDAGPERLAENAPDANTSQPLVKKARLKKGVELSSNRQHRDGKRERAQAKWINVRNQQHGTVRHTRQSTILQDWQSASTAETKVGTPLIYYTESRTHEADFPLVKRIRTGAGINPDESLRSLVRPSIQPSQRDTAQLLHWRDRIRASREDDNMDDPRALGVKWTPSTASDEAAVVHADSEPHAKSKKMPVRRVALSRPYQRHLVTSPKDRKYLSSIGPKLDARMKHLDWLIHGDAESSETFLPTRKPAITRASSANTPDAEHTELDIAGMLGELDDNLKSTQRKPTKAFGLMPYQSSRASQTPAAQSRRFATKAEAKDQPQERKQAPGIDAEAPPAEKRDQKEGEKSKKTIAEIDRELMEKMAGRVGDGGEAGVEYEDGQPTAMKRGVRENMFRYI
ncbi:MAG: hypothetical protein Q9159_000707 [Coniocarpon cinnabarinum]